MVRMRCRGSGWLITAVLLSLPALADTFSASGGEPGTWGVPYGWVGPRSTRAWEEYRKRANPGGNPPVSASNIGSDGVRFDAIRQFSSGGDGSSDLSIAPGLFLGTARALASPSQAIVQLSAGPANPDLRMGFMEDQGAGGGASLSVFVQHKGGDDGARMDAYFGNWGVDGLYVQFQLLSGGPTWQIKSVGVQLKAAGSLTSQLPLIDDQLLVNGATVTALPVDLQIPTTGPLAIRWDLRQDRGRTSLEGFLGSVPFSWTLDDGVTRLGLTDPGNPDGVGYQGGALDLTAMVPFWYAGVVSESVDVPALPLDTRLAGAVPQLQSLPDRATTHHPVEMLVRALNPDGSVNVSYGQTVEFHSTDPAATLPPAYTFTAQDQGEHHFQMQFGSHGLHTVSVQDQETPALTTQQTGIKVRTVYEVGCGSMPLLLLGPLAHAVRRARARRGGGT